MTSKAYIPVQSASISAASSGNNTIVAATAGKRIRVHGFSLVAAGAVTAQWQTAAGGTAKTGAASLITGTAWTLPYSDRGWFDCTIGQLLNLSLGGAVQVSGVVNYSVR